MIPGTPPFRGDHYWWLVVSIRRVKPSFLSFFLAMPTMVGAAPNFGLWVP
jgi:hypothetical protein